MKSSQITMRIVMDQLTHPRTEKRTPSTSYIPAVIKTCYLRDVRLEGMSKKKRRINGRGTRLIVHPATRQGSWRCALRSSNLRLPCNRVIHEDVWMSFIGRPTMRSCFPCEPFPFALPVLNISSHLSTPGSHLSTFSS